MPLDLVKSNQISRIDLKEKSVNIQTVGELYSGPGGIGLGAAMASVSTRDSVWITQPKWVNDYDPDSCETWRHNVLRYEAEAKDLHEDVAVIAGDVRKLDLQSLSPVDGLMFGFPCNDFSLVGEKKGIDGTFGPLYSYGVKILNRQDPPKWFIAENVSGLTSSNGGRAFDIIQKEMVDAGYEITAHKFKLEQYGVPQARHRIIIVGMHKDLGLKYLPPIPTGEIVTSREALSSIPDTASNQELTKQSKTVIERLSHIKPGQNVWNADLPDHLRLNVPRTKLSHIYKRLDPDKPSYTVTGSGGGGTHMYHWAQNRALTNRERARLQTFPDWFEFKGSKESVRKQIGMAIPVLGAKLIVESVLKTLAGVEYESIPPNL